MEHNLPVLELRVHGMDACLVVADIETPSIPATRTHTHICIHYMYTCKVAGTSQR